MIQISLSTHFRIVGFIYLGSIYLGFTFITDLVLGKTYLGFTLPVLFFLGFRVYFKL
jgi:hypothetical protein